MSFNPDVLSLVMVFLAIFMTFCSSLYGGRRSLPRLVAPCAFCLCACLASIADDWLLFIVFLELSSIALVFMVGEKDRDTARYYLYTQLAGGGILMVATALGSIRGFSIPMGPVPEGVFPLFVLGLGVKAALPGLHFWLPKTHSQAPAEASALLSGYAVKMGIYGLFRIVLSSSTVLMFLGALMAIWGAVMGPFQSDAKRLLAYSTLSQLGFMVAAISTGTELGRIAALAHLISHALAKGLLFFSAGGLEKIWGTRDLALTGPTFRSHRWMFFAFLIGALSMAGLPLSPGAWSKGLIKLSLEGHDLILLALTLSGVGTSLSLCKMGYYGFLKPFYGAEKRSIPGVVPLCSGCSMALMCLAILSLSSLPPFRPVGSSLSSALPAMVGLSLFVLIPVPFRPRYRPKDVEDIVPCLGDIFFRIVSSVRKLHSGNLVAYLFTLVTVAFLVLNFLQNAMKTLRR